MGRVWVIITHDIDWPKQGPSVKHILERRDRFTSNIIKKVVREGFNPYYGIRKLMEIEESRGIKSTFFFRPVYDDGTKASCYEDDLKDLVRGGWEIGLHLNSVESLSEIIKEKRVLEELIPPAGRPLIGCRVHYLRIKLSDYWKLKKAGFRYDSSIKYCKDRLCIEDTGFKVAEGIIIFPITIMDTYLFTYMRIGERDVIKVISGFINYLIKRGGGVVTILWHDSSINMIGGRMYESVVDYLHSNEEVKILRGVDALRMVCGELINEN